MKLETATPEPTSIARLIDRAEMLDLYRADLVKVEAAVTQKRAEWENLKAKAEAVCDLRDEARDQLNVIFGQGQALRSLIAYHEAQAAPPVEAG